MNYYLSIPAFLYFWIGSSYTIGYYEQKHRDDYPAPNLKIIVAAVFWPWYLFLFIVKIPFLVGKYVYKIIHD